MIILPKNYSKTLDCINTRGVQANIYVDRERIRAYKIYRSTFDYNEKKFNSFTKIQHPNIIKPLEPIKIEGNENFSGYSMEYVEGVSLPFVRNISMDDLIKAALEIEDIINEISFNCFLVWDGNAENIMYSNGFKFVDTYTYSLLKGSICKILDKWNMSFINPVILRGLIGFSYKHLISKYLFVVSLKYYDMYKNLNPSKGNFIYEVLSILQEVTQENNLDEVKLKLLVPTTKY